MLSLKYRIFTVTPHLALYPLHQFNDLEIGSLGTHGYYGPSDPGNSPAPGEKATKFHGQVYLAHHVDQVIISRTYAENSCQAGEDVLQNFRAAAPGGKIDLVAGLIFPHTEKMTVFVGSLAVIKGYRTDFFPGRNPVFR